MKMIYKMISALGPFELGNTSIKLWFPRFGYDSVAFGP